jgi:hypothetical protein
MHVHQAFPSRIVDNREDLLSGVSVNDPAPSIGMPGDMEVDTKRLAHSGEA